MNDFSPPPNESISPPHDIATELRNLDWSYLTELAAYGASYWRSMEEAAFRGDITAFSVHLRQARLIAFAAVKALEEYFGRDGAGGCE